VRILRVLVPGVLLLGLIASSAMGDSVDPTVVIRQIDPPNPIAITQPGQVFPFLAFGNPNNTADVPVQNQTGQTITSVTLTLFGTNILTGDSLSFSCGESEESDPFAECGAAQGQNGSTVLTFSGGVGMLAAVSGIELESLFLSSNQPPGSCTNCQGGIYDIEFGGADFTTGSIVLGFGTGSVGTAPVPEPGSALLLLSGLIGLAAWWKRSKKSSPAVTA